MNSSAEQSSLAPARREQPASLEQLQPLAHDRSTEAELLAERRLGREHVAVRKRSADDPVAELLEDE